MRAVIGLLLLLAGAELIYLVITGKLANAGKQQGTGGGPDDQPAAYEGQLRPAINMATWGTHAAAKVVP